MRRVHRWRALPAWRRALAWRALATVAVVRVLLALPFRAWLPSVRLLRRVTPKLVPPGATPRDVAWAVARASALIPGASCLTRALATRLLIPLGWTAPVLRLGVHRSMTGELHGHAWLETPDGVLIGDDELERYAPLGSWRATTEDHSPGRDIAQAARG